jgi:DNA-binding GntR family transcriptional regulator
MRALRILPEVLEDTAQAAHWYDDEGYVGLGDRFLAVFYSCCGRDGASRSWGNQKWVSNSQRSLGIGRKRLHRRGSVSAFQHVSF